MKLIELSSMTATERERLGLLVADAWGLMAAGSTAPGISDVVAACADLGPGELTIPFTSGGWSAQSGAAAASALIHGWDFDDTHDDAVVHTAAVAVPTALVAAQSAGHVADGAAFLRGVVTGVQALARLSGLVGPRNGVIRTAGLGAPAAAAAAAATWGMDEESIVNAMSLAVGAALAPGSRQAVVDSSLAKRVQPGAAVQAGLFAAALGSRGIVGPAGWLSGEYGLAPGSDASGAELLSGAFAGAELAIKPYPACRYGHAAIAAAEQLLGDHGAQPGDKVLVHLPAGPAYAMVARPFEGRGEPIIDAQFSVPWQVASLWTTGRYDVTTLAGPDVTDPRIAQFAQSVEVLQDLPESTVMDGARVELHRGDNVFTAESPMPGGTEAPLSRDDVTAKLRGCLTIGGFDPEVESSRIWSFVDQLPTLSANELAGALSEFTPARQPVA